MILSTHGIVGSQIASASLLLDLYPSAAVAYSVRKLRTLYTGSAIRVRRSSDNAESDIGFSGANLDTSALTTFCSGTNGFVTTWYDQSGNARNATQTTAANQPQIVSSGSVINVNSKPAVTFQDSTDLLRYQGSTTAIQTNTMAVVFKFNNTNSYGVVMSIGLTSSLCYTLTAQPVNQRSIYSPSFNCLDGTATTNQEIWGSTTSGLGSKFWFNGANQTITNPTATFNADQANILIGNDTFGSTRLPNVQECVYWATTQSDSNLVAINTNQNTYFNVY